MPHAVRGVRRAARPRRFPVVRGLRGVVSSLGGDRLSGVRGALERRRCPVLGMPTEASGLSILSKRGVVRRRIATGHSSFKIRREGSLGRAVGAANGGRGRPSGVARGRRAGAGASSFCSTARPGIQSGGSPGPRLVASHRRAGPFRPSAAPLDASSGGFTKERAAAQCGRGF